jgi:hypothetical protein
MRYTNKENTVLAGKLPAGNTVTIKIIDMETDTPVILTSDVCNESSSIPGIYLFNLEGNMNKPNEMKNYLYVMSDGNSQFMGKFVYGGELQDNIRDILDVESGNWEILGTQMIFYRKDGTELFRFNLYDKNNNLNVEQVYKRVRV